MNKRRTEKHEDRWVRVGNGRIALWHRPGSKVIPRLNAFGCDCVTTLLSAREGAAVTGEMVEKAGIKWIWLPMENGGPPQGRARERLITGMMEVAACLDAGHSILIHCSAGIHRTGMAAYLLLRMLGHDEADALAMIGRMRAYTLEGLQSKHIDWVDELAGIAGWK